jgi:hypothetical protein
MRDSVVVPIYDLEANDSVVTVSLSKTQTAICTRVQSMPHEFIGESVERCPDDALLRIKEGVRRFLAIEQRRTKSPPAVPESPRGDWWPRQNDVHFALNAAIGSDDKLYSVIADNDWSSRPSATYTATVRLTSKTKPRRTRWEIPVTGGWVVTGDLYSISYKRFEQSRPRGSYPKELSAKESALVAGRQRTTLSLGTAGAPDGP